MLAGACVPDPGATVPRLVPLVSHEDVRAPRPAGFQSQLANTQHPTPNTGLRYDHTESMKWLPSHA